MFDVCCKRDTKSLYCTNKPNHLGQGETHRAYESAAISGKGSTFLSHNRWKGDSLSQGNFSTNKGGLTP